jgi:hypothetical protein
MATVTEDKLFMLLLGCKPAGRNTEQHDIFFGIGRSLKDLVPDILAFWPQADEKVHIDVWREVQYADGHRITVVPREPGLPLQENKLYFINLGGYKRNEFEEYHYKVLSVCRDKATAIQRAKETHFFKHTGFESAHAHIDDKYGIDVDDIDEIEDILPPAMKEKYSVRVAPADPAPEDPLYPGYLKLNRL